MLSTSDPICIGHGIQEVKCFGEAALSPVNSAESSSAARDWIKYEFVSGWALQYLPALGLTKFYHLPDLT